MSEHRLDFLKDFDVPQFADWLEVAREELQGSDPETKLAWQVDDLQGLPYYTANHTNSLITSSAIIPPWKNMPLVTVNNETESNRFALDHLNEGADGILFSIPNNSVISFEKLLKKIEWPHCTISFLLDELNTIFPSALHDYIGKAGFNSGELTGSIFIKTYPQHPQTINNLIHNLIPFTNFDSLGFYIHSGKPADRIASALTEAVQVAEHLAAAGISQSVSLQRISFAIETGADFFIEIATLKALRMLWFQVVHAYGLSDYQPADLTIHSISPAWVNQALAPHSNMLKSTTASLAAIIGGCNALSVLPEA
ncbi:MAG: methylmalonyl-CoA mutase family protein, partial [Cyclobacteriaceae bacterium]